MVWSSRIFFVFTYILSTSKVYSLHVNYATSTGHDGLINKNAKLLEEERLWNEKKRQRGVSFPSAVKQGHLLIVRLDLKPKAKGENKFVSQGLKKLCDLFERIDAGEVKI